mmetsp:Transcript_15565/g.32977  ORF Transcript_15565/g.32977 Transcript_15565/m.32977 type:complete len:209 (-) Transcript_15565:47-673(-)
MLLQLLRVLAKATPGDHSEPLAGLLVLLDRSQEIEVQVSADILLLDDIRHLAAPRRVHPSRKDNHVPRLLRIQHAEEVLVGEASGILDDLLFQDAAVGHMLEDALDIAHVVREDENVLLGRTDLLQFDGLNLGRLHEVLVHLGHFDLLIDIVLDHLVQSEALLVFERQVLPEPLNGPAKAGGHGPDGLCSNLLIVVLSHPPEVLEALR